MGNGKRILNDASQTIFANNGNTLPRKARSNPTPKISNRELEVALTAVLVDLASCDQEFQQREYQVISLGLRRLFGTAKTDIQGLVNQAKLALANLRGTTRFTTLLRESLSIDQRKIVLEVVDELISADGSEDGFETYLRGKFTHLMGLDTPDSTKTS